MTGLPGGGASYSHSHGLSWAEGHCPLSGASLVHTPLRKHCQLICDLSEASGLTDLTGVKSLCLGVVLARGLTDGQTTTPARAKSPRDFSRRLDDTAAGWEKRDLLGEWCWKSGSHLGKKLAPYLTP